MVISLDQYDWADIKKVIFGMIDEKNPREQMRYACCKVDLMDDTMTVYGVISTQITRMVVRPRRLQKKPHGLSFTFLLKPCKAPAGMRSVDIIVDEIDPEVYLDFYGADGFSMGERIHFAQPSGKKPDYDDVFKKLHDDIDHFNHGDGQYRLAVDAKLLSEALSAFGKQPVMINFGDLNHPFSIRPLDSDMDARTFLFPIRVV